MTNRVTKAQLQAQVEALRHNAELLETEVARLRAELAAAEAKLAASAAPVKAVAAPVVAKPITVPRTTRPVFEFNPALPGDFARAAKLAREFKGCTRRCA